MSVKVGDWIMFQCTAILWFYPYSEIEMVTFVGDHEVITTSGTKLNKALIIEVRRYQECQKD